MSRSLGRQSRCPPPPSEQDFARSWEATPRTLSDILWSSASRLGFVDGLSLSQATHSREMTAGIYIMKEPVCFFLCAVRHEPWTVSPGWLERSEEASPSLEFVPLATYRGEALGSPTSNRVWSGLLQT